MAYFKSLTIKEQLKSLGINSDEFEVFYKHLSVDRSVPIPSLFTRGQYEKILDYLKKMNVIGTDGELQIDGFKVFDAKRQLELTHKVMLKPSPPTTHLSGVKPPISRPLKPLRRF